MNKEQWEAYYIRSGYTAGDVYTSNGGKLVAKHQTEASDRMVPSMLLSI